MNIIKKIVTCSLLACMSIFFVFNTTGCSTPTAEELIKETNANISKISSFEANAKLDLDMNMSMSGTEIPFATTFDLNIKATTKPSVIHMAGNMSMNLFGGSNKTDMESYVTVDGKDIITYTKESDGSSWSKTISEGEESPSSDILSMLSGVTVSDAKYTLEETKEKINDADVYLLKATLNYDQVKSILGSSLFKDSAITNELTSENYDYSNFKPSVEIYIYKDSKLPAKVTLDMAKALENMMNTVSGATADEASSTQSSVSAKKFNISLTFSNFNKVDAITIPESVLSSAESNSSTNETISPEETIVPEETTTSSKED